MTRWAFLMVAAVIGLVPTAWAATRGLGGLSFEQPAGLPWTEQTDGSVYYYEHKFDNYGAGISILQVGFLPGFSGSIEDGFKQVTQTVGVMTDVAPRDDVTGVTTAGLPIRWSFTCCQFHGTDANVTLAAVQHPKGLAYVASVLVRPTTEMKTAADAAMEAIVGSFDFGDGRRPVLPLPPPGETGLNGLYLGMVGEYRYAPGGAANYVVVPKLIYFEPGGAFAREAPARENLCSEKPRTCGRYGLSESRITFNEIGWRFGVVEPRTVEFERKGEDLKISGTSYRNIAPSPPRTLSGNWKSLYFVSGTNPNGTGGSVTMINRFEFSADGRFKRTGFTSVSSTSDIGGDRVTSTGSSADPLSEGQYTIRDFALTLTGADGTSETISIAIVDQADPSLLLIDGDPYLREDGP